jgi:hypothetical protein
VFPLIQAQMESRTFAPMQGKGHPKMTETTVNSGMPLDISSKPRRNIDIGVDPPSRLTGRTVKSCRKTLIISSPDDLADRLHLVSQMLADR